MVFYPCIKCYKHVRPRQHAVACDSCGRWQHRTCDTGIDIDTYRNAVQNGDDIAYICRPCTDKIPMLEPGENQEAVLPDESGHNVSNTEAPGFGDFTVSNSLLSVSDRLLETHEPDSNVSGAFGDFTVVNSFLASEISTASLLNVTCVVSGEADGDRSHVEMLPQVSHVEEADNVAMSEISAISGNNSYSADIAFRQPSQILVESLDDPAIQNNTTEDRPIAFELVPGGTQKGKDLLIDSLGYAYNIKQTRRDGRYRSWICSVRNKTVKCPAGVLEHDREYRANSHEHVHPPDPSRYLTAIVTKKAKEVAMRETFKPASTIVDDVRADVVRRNDIAPLNVDYISRRVNRKRQQMRPEDPRDMNFELDEGALPEDFFKAEIEVKQNRHLVFATDRQLELLTKSKRWFIDGTFKVMRLPFIMLLTIHAFVRRGDCSKQVPLVYVMMTGKSAKDYASVLRGIVQLLGGNICLEGVVLDYERAIWKALRVVFQDRQISFQGCAFHWGQAVWRHVQSLGLASQYLSDAGTRCFIRKLLSLPFIPAEHIEPTFDALRSFNSSDNIEPLLDYVHTNWIQSSFWPIQCWCVYGQSVRANNDVEGWHNRLNSRAGVAPAFYNIVRKLREESTFVEQQVTLVSEMRLKKIQRMSYRSTQARLFAAWDSYRSSEISTTGLLKKVSNIYTPRLKRHEEDQEDKE